MAEMLLFQQHTLFWLDEIVSDRRNFLCKYGYTIVTMHRKTDLFAHFVKIELLVSP